MFRNHDMPLPRDRSGHVYLLIVVGLLAAVLRLHHLGSGLWYDEIVTVEEYVRLPVGHLVSSYAHANHHVLNSLLAKAATAAFGEAAWSVRLPAAIFGVGGVGAFWFVARGIWPAQVALSATLLFALSYPHVFYSQSARGYSALIFFALLATGFAVGGAATPGRGEGRATGLGYAVSIALGLYAMLLMAFVAAGHGVVFLATRRWRALGWLLAGVAGAVVLYGPMVPDLVNYYRLSPSYTGNPLLSADFARELGRVWPVLLIMAAAGAIVLGRLLRRDRWLAMLVVTPLALNILVPLVRGQGVHPRSFMYALPLAHLFLGELLAWCSTVHPVLMRSVALTVALVSIAPLPGYYAVPKQGFDQALAWVSRERSPSDVIVGVSMAGRAARFYDPSVIALENGDALDEWLSRDGRPAWVLATFPGQLSRDYPRLAAWIERDTERRAVFAAAVGDGVVAVHRWDPTHSGFTR